MKDIALQFEQEIDSSTFIEINDNEKAERVAHVLTRKLQDIVDIDSYVAAEKARIDQKASELKEGIEKEVRNLAAALNFYAKPIVSGQKSQTHKLVNGEISYRKGSEKVEYSDEQTTIDHLKENNPVLVKTTVTVKNCSESDLEIIKTISGSFEVAEKVSKTDVKNLIKKGEEVPGAAIEKSSDTVTLNMSGLKAQFPVKEIENLQVEGR